MKKVGVKSGTVFRSKSVFLRERQGLYDFLFFLATEAKPVRLADQAVAERFGKLERQALAALGGE